MSFNRYSDPRKPTPLEIHCKHTFPSQIESKRIKQMIKDYLKEMGYKHNEIVINVGDEKRRLR